MSLRNRDQFLFVLNFERLLELGLLFALVTEVEYFNRIILLWVHVFRLGFLTLLTYDSLAFLALSHFHRYLLADIANQIGIFGVSLKMNGMTLPEDHLSLLQTDVKILWPFENFLHLIN